MMDRVSFLSSLYHLSGIVVGRAVAGTLQSFCLLEADGMMRRAHRWRSLRWDYGRGGVGDGREDGGDEGRLHLGILTGSDCEDEGEGENEGVQ